MPSGLRLYLHCLFIGRKAYLFGTHKLQVADIFDSFISATCILWEVIELLVMSKFERYHTVVNFLAPPSQWVLANSICTESIVRIGYKQKLLCGLCVCTGNIAHI